MADKEPESYKDPYWSNLAEAAAKKHGVVPGFLTSIVQNGEKSNKSAVSSANAQTVFQITPETRKLALDKWGVDAYLNGKNAAEVAALLAKESQDRNKGDVGAMAAEYHAGPDRKKWGPITEAYQKRVIQGMGAEDKGGNFYTRAVSRQSAQENQQPSIAKVYDAYAKGLMTTDDAKVFEDAVNNGEIMLPRGAALKKAAEVPFAPQGVTEAYVSGKMSPEDKAVLEDAMKAGQIRLQPTAQSQIPTGDQPVPTEQGLLQPEAPKPSLAKRLIGGLQGVGETALTLGSGAVATIPATMGALNAIASGATPQQAEAAFQAPMQSMTYQPRSEQGREMVGDVGQFMSDVVVPATAVFPPASMEANALGQAMKTASQMGRTAGAIAKPQIVAGAKQAAQQVAESVKTAPSKVANAVRGAVTSPEFDTYQIPQQAAPAAEAAKPSAIPAGRSVGAAAVTNPQAAEPKTLFQPKPVFSTTPLPEAAQAERAAALQEIGLTNARKSSITGDPLSGATEANIAKLDSDAGRLMRNQLDTEKQALSGYAQKIVDDAGGTQGADGASRIARGEAIIEPLERYSQWFDDQAKALYQAADKRASGVPVELSGASRIIQKRSTLPNVESKQLINGFKAFAADIDAVAPDGTIQATAKQAETLRKYLNDGWSPQNAKVNRALKEAIDSDVFKAAGDDIYSAARDMWKQRKTTIDNPKGMAALLDVDSGRINRKVALEKIADAVWGQSNAQFQHVIKTLRSVPDELRPYAQQAINEIKTEFAQKVLDTGNKNAGQWNSIEVAKVLNQNNAKLHYLFTPEEVQRLKTLNTAGHALSKDQSYPGAAAQTLNLVQSGAVNAARLIPAAVGSVVGGPAGAAAGAAAGAKLGSMTAERAAMKAAQKRIVTLKK